jgi:hypothetical protein
MKTNELTGAALDWAVAKCEGPNSVAACYYDEDDLPMCRDEAPHMEWKPSTNWAQGGPIIDREDIALGSTPDGLWSAYAPKGTRWIKYADKAVEYFHWTYKGQGYTPLIAAMRCYVASKLGAEIDVPEELCQPTA